MHGITGMINKIVTTFVVLALLIGIGAAAVAWTPLTLPTVLFAFAAAIVAVCIVWSGNP